MLFQPIHRRLQRRLLPMRRSKPRLLHAQHVKHAHPKRLRQLRHIQDWRVHSKIRLSNTSRICSPTPDSSPWAISLRTCFRRNTISTSASLSGSISSAQLGQTSPSPSFLADPDSRFSTKTNVGIKSTLRTLKLRRIDLRRYVYSNRARLCARSVTIRSASVPVVCDMANLLHHANFLRKPFFSFLPIASINLIRCIVQEMC